MPVSKRSRLPAVPLHLSSQVAAFLVAGFESTAHSVSWALYEIARHPEVQQKLAAELEGAGLLWRPGGRRGARATRVSVVAPSLRRRTEGVASHWPIPCRVVAVARAQLLATGKPAFRAVFTGRQTVWLPSQPCRPAGAPAGACRPDGTALPRPGVKCCRGTER